MAKKVSVNYFWNVVCFVALGLFAVRSILGVLNLSSPWLGIFENITVGNGFYPSASPPGSSPKLTWIALFTLFITLSSRCPIFSFNRFLSIVLICSSSMMLSFASPALVPGISMCVGNFALPILDVIAAAITVGLYLFPTSFCTIRTGRRPPCSLPTTGLRSA